MDKDLMDIVITMIIFIACVLSIVALDSFGTAFVYGGWWLQ